MKVEMRLRLNRRRRRKSKIETEVEIEGNRAFDPRDLDLDLGGSPAALVRLDSCGRVGH